MVKSLRRAHFAIWRAIAFMLPIAFVLALVFRPEPISEKKVVSSFQFSSARTDSSLQVTVHVLNPITTPSCLVYALMEGQEKLLLGKLEKRGTYTFISPIQTTDLLLLDVIRNKEIVTYTISNEL